MHSDLHYNKNIQTAASPFYFGLRSGAEISVEGVLWGSGFRRLSLSVTLRRQHLRKILRILGDLLALGNGTVGA